MNGAVPLGNRRHRSGTARGQSGPSGIGPGVVGLVSRTEDPGSGTETRKAAGVKSGGWKRAGWLGLSFDRVVALSVLPLGGDYCEPKLFSDRSRNESAYRMRLPSRGLSQFLRGYATGPLDQIEHHVRLASFPRSFGFRRGFGRLLRPSGLLLRGCWLRRDVGRLWRYHWQRRGLGNCHFAGFRGNRRGLWIVVSFVCSATMLRVRVGLAVAGWGTSEANTDRL